MFLQAQLDLENCIDIATIAETYSLSQLRQRVYRFMSGHLREFSRSPDFHRLAPQQLEYLLGCDFPVDCPEAEVLQIVVRWLLASTHTVTAGQRLACAQRLLRRIHFAEIMPWDLEAVQQQSLLGHSYQDQHLFHLVLSETCRQSRVRPTLPNTSSVVPVSKTSPLVNSRGMELAVVKVGGFGIGGITNEITYFLPSVGKWRHLTSIPHVEQCNFGTAVLDNDLYVVGGCFNQSLQVSYILFYSLVYPDSSVCHTGYRMSVGRTGYRMSVCRTGYRMSESHCAVFGIVLQCVSVTGNSVNKTQTRNCSKFAFV